MSAVGTGFPTVSIAINKCIGPDGKISYSDAPCEGRAKRSEVQLQKIPAATPNNQRGDANGISSQSREAEMVRVMKKQRRESDINHEIAMREANIDRFRRQMETELAALRQKKGTANNNYAGATWEQSISTEMTAVASSYDVKIRMEQERLQSLRADAKALTETP